MTIIGVHGNEPVKDGTKMAKEWVKGRNCEFKAERDGVGVGVKAWCYRVTKEDVTFLTKKDQTPSLKEVTIPVDEAENFVAVKPGKPREDFASLFETKAETTVAPGADLTPEASEILRATIERAKANAA